ncbi:hypothetical protein C9374_012898 [Naegleria lovaniensis]|uniref:Uncharacterized protein n=1 Tax=Naegleria lovaniensis TaxID=51637 RepID=A0AA88G7D7_NAELO|nr:uncharacterized protein C9374_012898 [Naegleria lovaniensis]KAG2373052.1 hypothetical protein C9374_012898 [Naegleria lovaniensis]
MNLKRTNGYGISTEVGDNLGTCSAVAILPHVLTIGKTKERGKDVHSFANPSSIAISYYQSCIFSWEGQFVKSFGNDNQLYCARAICFCKVTGELIICDSDNHRVLVLR